MNWLKALYALRLDDMCCGEFVLADDGGCRCEKVKPMKAL
jgi:hypothetical protein